jgi:hypothetical protein
MRLQSHRSSAVTLMLILLAGCTGAELTDPTLPETIETPGAGPPTVVGAVLYGTFFTGRPLYSSSVSFEVLDVDCTSPIQGVNRVNRLPGKKKFTYKYQLTVERPSFQACVRIRNHYTFFQEEAPRVAEATRSVLFTQEGAEMTAAGLQVNLALP